MLNECWITLISCGITVPNNRMNSSIIRNSKLRTQNPSIAQKAAFQAKGRRNIPQVIQRLFNIDL